MFRKAQRKQLKAKVMMIGASGSGKTMSALLLAKSFGSKIAVIDTENGSSEIYSDIADFDVVHLNAPNYGPDDYIKPIDYAIAHDYDCIIIDSISHFWEWVLDYHSKLGGKSSFNDWAKANPIYKKLIDKILYSDINIIVTARSKTVYDVSEDGGKKKIQKMGSAPKFREGLDYEMTVVFSINQFHMAEADKDRTGLFDGQSFMIDESTGEKIRNFLNSGISYSEIKEKAKSEIEKASDYPSLVVIFNKYHELKKDEEVIDLMKEKRKSLEAKQTEEVENGNSENVP